MRETRRSKLNCLNSIQNEKISEKISDLLMGILHPVIPVAALEAAIESMQAVPELLISLSELTGIEPAELGLNEARVIIKRLIDMAQKVKQERGFSV